MPQIVCNIALDVSVNDSGQIIMAKEGDCKSRLLTVRLTDCGRPLPIETDAAVLLNVSRDDASAAFEGRVMADGAARFTLPAFALEKAGSVLCDVSVLDADGGRLTSSHFTIEVESAVAPDTELAEGEEADLAATLLAEEALHPLAPVTGEAGYVLAPTLNRKYTVDLSDEIYAPDGVWLPLSLQLPTPEHVEREHWILLYCHAPIREASGAVVLDWGASADILFADGVTPQITMGDFDIVCTYSAAAGRWQIGVFRRGWS